MEISIKFRFHDKQKNDTKPRPLKIRLTMDGITVTDYMAGVECRPTTWNQDEQMVKGRNRLADVTNERLEEIKAKHFDILREMKRLYARGQGPRPTAELVKAEYIKPGSLSPTLVEFFEKHYLPYVHNLSETEDGKAEKTVARVKKTLEHVKSFMGEESVLIIDVTTNWAKKFHIWLQIHPTTGKKRMIKDSANKYLSHVRDAMEYAIDEGYLQANVLNRFRPKRGKPKPIIFLEPEHIDRFVAIETDDMQLRHVLWWSKLMIYTGMDYKDAQRYALDRSSFERRNEAGIKIMISRAKGDEPCEIPLLPEVTALFDIYPTGPHAPLLSDLNRHLKVLPGVIDFKHKLTSKVLRKTAGVVFLRLGYTIEAVSRFLGHQSIRTTLTHYVAITSSYVDAEMNRVKAAR